MALPTAPDGDLAAFCDVLTEFIKLEARAQRNQHMNQILRPLEERVIDERCLAELRSDGEFEPDIRTFRFTCDGKFGNTARFREGDRLRLHRGDYQQGFDVMLTSEADSGVYIPPETMKADLSIALKDSPAGWLLD